MAADFIIIHVEGAEHDYRYSGSGTARNLKSVRRVPGVHRVRTIGNTEESRERS